MRWQVQSSVRGVTTGVGVLSCRWAPGREEGDTRGAEVRRKAAATGPFAWVAAEPYAGYAH